MWWLCFVLCSVVLYRRWLWFALCLLFCIDDGYVVRYVLFCVLGIAYFVLGDGYGWYYVCLFDCGVVSFVTSVLLSCIDNDYSLYCVCCFVCSVVLIKHEARKNQLGPEN